MVLNTEAGATIFSITCGDKPLRNFTTQNYMDWKMYKDTYAKFLPHQ
jgi:hypothetical protein